jgi:hypothetical protein
MIMVQADREMIDVAISGGIAECESAESATLIAAQ